MTRRRLWVCFLFGLLIAPLCAGQTGSTEAETDKLLAELRQVYRTLYALSEEAERAEVLGKLLTHDAPSMRAFGLDLARRTLLNARDVPGEVLEKGTELLFDDVPSVRTNAAKLIATRGGEKSSSSLARALRAETDPDVATEILRALSQSPGEMPIEQVFEWMDRGGAVSDASFAVARTIIRKRGENVDEAARMRLRELLGSFDGETSTPSRVALAWELGMTAYVKAALRSDDIDLRTTSAERLARDGAHLNALLEAARAEPRIVPVVIEAIARHRPTVEGYRLAKELPAPSEDARREALRKIRVAMGPAALLKVARTESDLFQREALLRHIEGTGFAERLNTDTGWSEALGELIVTRTKIGDCAGVLSAGARLRSLGGEAMEERVAFCLIRCRLAMGQIDEASSMTRGMLETGEATMVGLARAWVSGIESLAKAGGNAGEASSKARELLGEALSTEQLAALASYSQPADDDERTENVEQAEDPGEPIGGTIPTP